MSHQLDILTSEKITSAGTLGGSLAGVFLRGQSSRIATSTDCLLPHTTNQRRKVVMHTDSRCVWAFLVSSSRPCVSSQWRGVFAFYIAGSSHPCAAGRFSFSPTTTGRLSFVSGFINRIRAFKNVGDGLLAKCLTVLSGFFNTLTMGRYEFYLPGACGVGAGFKQCVIALFILSAPRWGGPWLSGGIGRRKPRRSETNDTRAHKAYHFAGSTPA